MNARVRALLPALLPVLGCALVVAVLFAADRSPTGDGPHLAGAELRLAQLLRTGDPIRAWRLFVTLIAPQPPVGYLPGIAAFLVLGGGRLAALTAMSASLLLLWDAYRRLGGGDARWSGAGPAWLLFVASPMTWLYVNQHGRDLVAGAAVLQAVSWLHASDGLRHRRASAAFGAWMAACLLTKYTAPFFLWAPCLAVGLGLLWRSARPGPSTRPAWANLGVAVATCLVLAGPWWLAYGERAASYLAFSSGSPGDISNTRSADTMRSLEGLAYYPLALKAAIGWPPLVLALVGFALPRGPRLAALSALGGVAVLSSLSAAQDRYALPALCALVAGVLPFARLAVGAPRLALLGPALVLALAVPLLAGTAARHGPGAAVAEAAYEHPLTTAPVLDWPTGTAYPPERFDAAAWELARAVEEVAAVQGASTGTVGLLASRTPQTPQFAEVLQVAGEAGKMWDYATVNLAYDPLGARGQPDPWFVGPLFDGAWPPRTFTTLLVLHAPGPDGKLEEWLTANAARLTERARWYLPNGGNGAVYAYAAE